MMFESDSFDGEEPLIHTPPDHKGASQCLTLVLRLTLCSG